MDNFYTRSILFFFTFTSLLFWAIPGRTQNIGGTDFWFTFPENRLGSQIYPPIKYQLVIVSGCDAAGRAEFPALGGASIPFTVSPGVPTVVDLPLNYNTLSEQVENNGVHITTDNRVAVYAINYKEQSVDGEGVLPTSMLGTDHVIQGYSERQPADFGPPQFTIVATEDNTVITITTSADTETSTMPVSHTAGSTWSVTLLLKGQTYMVSGAANVVSLSGTRVTSNKPVAIISHTICTNFKCTSCDIIMAQMLPRNTAGTRYITAQAQRRNYNPGWSLSDHLEITAFSTGANVTINRSSGDTTFTLGPFQSRVYVNPKSSASDPGEANTVIISDQPIQVSQYSQGAACDNNLSADPEHVILFPESGWISDYLFSCSTTLTSTGQGITIIADTSAGTHKQLSLNGSALAPGGWEAIGTSPYKFKRVAVPVGAYHLKSLNGSAFGFYQYAIGAYETYISQGGASYYNCFVSVPLNLISFKGKFENRHVVLNWATASEKNTDHFLIEKSTDNIRFTEAGRVNAAGNSALTRNYEFTDSDPRLTDLLTGTVYYRLKEIDPEGKAVFSKTISLNIPEKELLILMPNPIAASGKAEIVYMSGQAETIRIGIYNMFGQLLHAVSEISGKGENRISLDIAGYSPGQYILEFKTTKHVEIKKLIIQNSGG